MTERSPDELRVIDDQLLDAISAIATQYELSTADVLLRLLSLTAMWVLSQAPPDTSPAEQCSRLQTAMGNVFNHYARQLLEGRIH